MDELNILDAIERYIRGEMNAEEIKHFEHMRKNNASVDQLVVEHTLFLQKMDRFDKRKKFKSYLQPIHTGLQSRSKINAPSISGKTTVLSLWNRYKKVAGIAASIAGITALTVTAVVNLLSPKADNAQVVELGQKMKVLETNNDIINQELNSVKYSIKNKIEPGTLIKGGGTAFMIDGKGYLITNAHIIEKGKIVVIENNKGEQFKAEIIFLDLKKDLAIVKINDADFKTTSVLPYGISKSRPEVASRVFTLGYPRNDVVYSEGYLSAKTGFNGDTLSYQLGISVNYGNSGGPVFNQNGEIIGLLSTKEKQAEGVAFAIQSKYLLQTIEDLKKQNKEYKDIRATTNTLISGLNPGQQFNRIKDYVFLIRSY